MAVPGIKVEGKGGKGRIMLVVKMFLVQYMTLQAPRRYIRVGIGLRSTTPRLMLAAWCAA